MKQVDVAGLNLSAGTKKELLELLQVRIKQGQKTFLTTLYSEFLYAALRDEQIKNLLNQADIAVADGIGVLWAQKFLSLRFVFQNYWLKIMEAFWQMAYTGAAILLRPSSVRKVFPEKIVGADLVWDLAKLANDHNYSIYLLGGHDDTPKKVAFELSKKNLALKIAGYSNKNPDDESIIDDIKNTSPDILLVAFGPIKQEKWIVKNLQNLPVKLAIGVGGTFDYIAGERLSPPKFLREIGLEWLWRFFTQPQRIGRIFNATFGLISSLIKYKVFSSLPYRKNVVSVVANKENKIFIGKYNPNKETVRSLGTWDKDYTDYWQLPQGGLDEGEEIVEGARRELWEETAIRSVELIKVSDKTNAYDWRRIAQRPLWSKKRYHFRGQKQNIVYFRFTGQEKEIVLDLDEFVEYKWVAASELVSSIHPEKQPVAKIAQQELKQLL